MRLGHKLGQQWKTIMIKNDPNSRQLSGSVKELTNKYEIVPKFIEAGFVPYVPEYDVGVDFILNLEGSLTSDASQKKAGRELFLKVQLKSRWYLEKKYFGRDIWMLFPNKPDGEGRIWYFCPHDFMVEKVPAKTRKTSKDWIKGAYGRREFNAELQPKKEEHFDWTYLREFQVDKVIDRISHSQLAKLRRNYAKDWLMLT